MKADPVGKGPFRRVAVLGLGVMGGSLARALALLPEPPARVGWSPDADECARARRDGTLTRAAQGPGDAVAGADLVVLAAPLGACVALVETVLPALEEGAVLTDVASLKTPIERAVTGAGGRSRWVGSHPMCGSADSGYSAARADLYKDAPVYLVAPAEAAALAPRLAAFWRSVGATPRATTSSEHDALMLFSSHLPQLTSTALALALEEAGLAASDLGPGGRDMTRLAGSSPGMWRDILERAFHPPLVDGLRAAAAQLERLADHLDERDLDALAEAMAKSRAWKERA